MRIHSVLVVLLLGVTALSMAPVAHIGGAPGAARTADQAATPIFSASAAWNGHPVAFATSAGHAISTSFGAPVTIEFQWNCPGTTGCGFGITDAILHVLYLGQVVWTKDQGFSSPGMPAVQGQYNLTSDLTGSKYLVEGLFLVQAVLLTNGGGGSWSQSFYVQVSAPNHVTVAVIGLGVLALYEVTALLRVGPHALPKRPKQPTGAASSPPEAKP
ncbi:MAG: hypothetical protein L3K18_07485 [Thermoplasmata archaeon]|nr:hypothetical protein [Thermoplasmata archaeon]